MRIAAIYIEDHQYLFDKPQTINFGGAYFYNFQRQRNDVIITRTKNKNFIEGFFDLKSLKSKVTNVNAIVGQNGAGKSTLLDLIRSEFIEHSNALPHSNSLFIVEADSSNKPIILRNDFNKIYLSEPNLKSKGKSLSLVELNDPLKRRVQTIFYSPHYDYKYNPNFDDVDNHDISFDKILDLDLAELNEKDNNESGGRYSPGRELMFKNSLRQIEFLSSELVDKQQIFKDIFHLQDHYDPILEFRGYKEIEREWNTPNAFRTTMKLITEKVTKEIDEWHKVKKFESDEVSIQVEINKYILKRTVLSCILSVLYKLMERKNSFLTGASFPHEKLKKELNHADAYTAFLLFIDNSILKSSSENTKKAFTLENFKLLLDTLYEAIDKCKTEDEVSNKKFKTTKEYVVKILSLQRSILNELNTYYYSFYKDKKDTIISDNDRIEEFVNYMPFRRRLSSGENALLNLFSRIYDFLNRNLKETKFRKLQQHYILLLDEADLSFHPNWKKKYVKAILSTIPHFFNELEGHPSLQFIFTTHDPLTLSDLPNSNVIYIERPTYESSSNILDYNNENRPVKTFGANISDLIADSFFIENSLMGNFVYDKIKETIKWLTDAKDKENIDYHMKVIRMIDEPIVQRKLAEMYDNKMVTQFQLSVINDQISKLQTIKRKLE